MTARKPKPPTRFTNNNVYHLDGEGVPGPTKVIGEGFPKPALINWAANATAEYARLHWDELAELPPEEREEVLRHSRKKLTKKATERGKEVHDQVVRYLAGQPIVPPEGLEGHVDAAIKFIEDWHVAEVAIEAACFSREYGYGGRLDLLARLADGLLWLLDWKTSSRGLYLENVLQLAAYRYADFYVLPGDVDERGWYVEHPMPVVDRVGVVWVRADGYDLYPVKADSEAFVVFGAVQQIAEFREYGEWGASDAWIGPSLLPPPLESEPVLSKEEQ
jgi:hypothetical protein